MVCTGPVITERGKRVANPVKKNNLVSVWSLAMAGHLFIDPALSTHRTVDTHSIVPLLSDGFLHLRSVHTYFQRELMRELTLLNSLRSTKSLPSASIILKAISNCLVVSAGSIDVWQRKSEQ